MKIRKITLYILCVITGFVSCSKKDNVLDGIVVEERDRTEQQVIDKDSLIGYLDSHYYNSSTFESNPNPSINDLIISELPEDGILPDPANNTLLIDAIEIKNTVYEEVDYEYYILRLNQGGGDVKPHFSDDVRVTYLGNLLNEEVFDSAVTPTDFDLTGLVTGWNRVLPGFNVAEDYIESGDGTINFSNAGVGVMFLPSGLGYYSQPPASSIITAYSSLIFRFELYQTEINDHDIDGVPTYLEDINNNLNLIDDDSDVDGIPDYLDFDDDEDGTLTVEEDLEDSDLNFDSNGDGILDNDLDGDGDPTNDDTDGDGIPNYLDTDNTQSNKDDNNN